MFHLYEGLHCLLCFFPRGGKAMYTQLTPSKLSEKTIIFEERKNLLEIFIVRNYSFHEINK